jgi:hypothetical protein
MKLSVLYKQIESIKERNTYFNNMFFVTFRTKKIRDAILREMSSSDTYISRLLTAVSKISLTLDDGRQITFRMKEAPEPSDINWHNLSVTMGTKIKSRAVTYLASFFLIAIGFGIVLGLKVWQRYLGNQLTPNASSFDASSLRFRGVSVLVSFVILMVNSILPMAMRNLTLLEKHTSNTDFFKSLTFKIALVSYT